MLRRRPGRGLLELFSPCMHDAHPAEFVRMCPTNSSDICGLSRLNPSKPFARGRPHGTIMVRQTLESTALAPISRPLTTHVHHGPHSRFLAPAGSSAASCCRYGRDHWIRSVVHVELRGGRREGAGEAAQSASLRLGQGEGLPPLSAGLCMHKALCPPLGHTRISCAVPLSVRGRR